MAVTEKVIRPLSLARREIARLFSENREALCTYVMRFARSRASAEEIVQEAFLRTFERVGTVKLPRAFLYATARNLALNTWRHERSAEIVMIRGEAEIVTQGKSPEEELLANEWIRLLKEAIARLTPACRAALTLKVLYECSHKEIAERLGIATKTVEKHVARGLRDTRADLTVRYADVGHQFGGSASIAGRA